MAISDDSKRGAATLAERLRARIRTGGPISFYEWMKAALYDEPDGYYCRADRVRWGRQGDYRTAPETSPLFAATLARYCAGLFAESGSPPSWTMIEAGAGSGEFAHSFLSALQSRRPALFAATTYLIDEFSADARARTAARLAEFGDRVKFRKLTEISKPLTHGVIFSNEMLDAFPVHRIRMSAEGLRELYVDLDTADKFTWTEGELSEEVAVYCDHARLSLGKGQVAEVNLAAAEFVAEGAALLEQGFMISVDYGGERADLIGEPGRREGTLRAFRDHQLAANPLSNPGEQDLTTTIDWTQIREAGERAGLVTMRYEALDKFLLREGLLEELEDSALSLTDVEALRVRTGAREMIMPHGLAASFQILVQQKCG
jgi:SAM-dependent MidA family methyltransferase